MPLHKRKRAVCVKKQWWHDKVAYQIYPKSFCDSNGDGVGDLRGIIGKLDYLKDLGVDIIWISPIYQSPFVDQGYDISDYYKIDPVFGTMEDFDELLAQAKQRNMSIVMDLVINHCSDKHEWFQKALADPEGEYGDYFYFRRGKNGGPPSNYRSYFGGSAWEPVPGREDLYYLHLFAKEQPDLNWNNPKVLEELYTMVNWWLDKGVAGFRVDAIINIKKDLNFPSFEPDGPDGLASAHKMIDGVQGVGELLEDLKEHTFKPHDAFTVAEVFNMKQEELAEFIGDDGHFSTMFDFSAHCLSYGEHGWYDSPGVGLDGFRDAVFHAQQECQGVGFLANIIENHDEPRGVSRYMPSYGQNERGAKFLGTVSVLLRGLPFLYQGQELGMTNCPMDSVEEYDDINTKNEYRVALAAGLTPEQALAACFANSRDNARTPMQWTAGENAGFTTGTPWLKVNPNHTAVNAAEQQGRAGSVLNYYKTLLALRKSPEYKEVFTYGDFIPLLEGEPEAIAYARALEGKRAVVVGNFGPEERTLTVPGTAGYRLLLTNLEEAPRDGERITLQSCQVAVLGN